jgi:hypothetical protein
MNVAGGHQAAGPAGARSALPGTTRKATAVGVLNGAQIGAATVRERFPDTLVNF